MNIDLLFPDIETLNKVVSGGNNTNSIEILQPKLLAALSDPIAQIVSEEFLDKVSDYLADDSLYSEDEKKLMNKVVLNIQIAAANLAYMQSANEGGVQVDDTGFHQLNNSETRQAFQWQMRDFKRAKEEIGWVALRALYRLLKKNISESIFESFLQSNEFLFLSSFILQDDKEFSRYCKIEGFETWYHLLNFQEKVQDETLRLILTEDVYTLVKSWIIDNEDADERLFYLCRKLVATGTILAAAPTLPFKVKNSGLTISEFIVNRDNAAQDIQGIEQTAKLIAAAKIDFERAKSDLTNYMWANASETVYPSFYNQKVLPTKEASMTQADIDSRNEDSKIVRL